MHPLFREPLRYDALSWLWLALVAGVYVLHLRLDTWPSGWAFVLAGVAVSSAAVLAVAVVRYLVDGPQRRVEGARTMREVLGIDVLPGVGDWQRGDSDPAPSADPAPSPEPHAPRPAVDPAPVAPSVPVPPPAPEPPEPVRVAPPLERPHAYRIEVSEVRVTEGTPVTVTWSFEGADSVVVDGRTGFPSHGQTTVAVRHSRSVLLVGANAAGVTAVTTAEIEVVADAAPAPAPRPAAVPPVQRLQIDLRGTAEGAGSVLAHLDRVLAAQDALRPIGSVRLAPIGVPSSFTRWLRGHPRQRFVGRDSTLQDLQRGPSAAGAPRRRHRSAASRARAETDRTTS